MDINFNSQVKGLDGQPLEGDKNTMSKILANLLAYSSSGPLTKFMDWARDLYATGEISIDRTDAEVLEGFIKNVEVLPNITKEQLIDVINQAKLKLVKK